MVSHLQIYVTTLNFTYEEANMDGLLFLHSTLSGINSSFSSKKHKQKSQCHWLTMQEGHQLGDIFLIIPSKVVIFIQYLYHCKKHVYKNIS